MNDKKLEKSLAVFFFLLMSRHLQVAQLVWASEPIEFGSAFPEILLQSGYQYTFNLTIENNKVKAKGVSISPWTTTESECTQNGTITL